MRISFFLIIGLMLAACTAGYGFQATITVGSTGNATTIQQAFQMMGSTVMADSVTLYLGDAVYNEGELSLTQHNGYPKSVKIMGNPLGEPPTINFTQQNSNGTAITVTSIEAFTMTGVNVSLSQSAGWGAAVSVHLTAGQLKTPSSSSGISIYAPTATKGLDVDIEGGGSYTVSASTITTDGPSVAPGTGVSKLTLTGNTFNTGSRVIDGANLRSDTVIIANNNITKTSNATSPVLDVVLTQGQNARYVWVHDNQVHLSGAATTAIDISSTAGGSIQVNNNLVTLGGFTSCDSRGLHISGFGGIGSTISITDDSISGGGVAIWLEGIKAGTAVTMDNLGLEAAVSGIMVGSSSYPSSVTIGSGGPDAMPSTGRWSPLGIYGRSKVRTTNNSRSIAPRTKPVNPLDAITSSVSCPTGAAIDLTLSSASCVVTIQSTESIWTGTDGISINGSFAGSISTIDNIVDLTGSANGIHVSAFGGLGATLTCTGDSISNADVGINLDSVASGTAVSLCNFGIRAITNGIAVPAGNHPSTLTIGTSGGGLVTTARKPSGIFGSSRARVMNNARSMAPVAGRGKLPFNSESLDNAGIAIGMTGGSCAVTIQGTDVVWVGNGISFDGHFTGTLHTSDNMVDLTGSGIGMHVTGFGGVGSNIDMQDDSLGNTGTGVLVDSAASGTHITIQNFGISAATSAIAIPAGNMPSMITLGGSGSGSVTPARSPLGTMGRSRGTARNNAAAMQPRAGRGDLTLGTNDSPGAAIDLAPSSSSCVVSIASTDVHWVSTTGVSVKGHFGGSISTSDNLIALAGGGTGMRVTGFGGVGSSIDMQDDSLANTGTGIVVDSTAAGTTTSIQNFGVSAGVSAISIPAGNMQSSLTIGGSGAGSVTAKRSPFGTMGRSRGTARNNAAAMMPGTKHGDPTLGTNDSPGAAIDVTISNPACAVTIASTDIQWVSTTGVSVAGHSNAAVTTSDNVITLAGAGTGMYFNGVGGTGGSISSSDDSLANTGYGIKLDGIVAGTAVSALDFGISAATSAIAIPAGSHLASLTIGGSGSGSVTSAKVPFGIMGRSRGTARNNAAMMRPGTEHGGETFGINDAPGAAFDIAVNDSTCPVTFLNTDIQWNGGNGIRMAQGKVLNVTISGNAISGNNATGYAGLVMDSVSAESILVASNSVASFLMLEKMWAKTNGNYEMRMNHFTGGGDSVHLSNGSLLVRDNEWTCTDGCLAEISPSFWCGTTSHFGMQPIAGSSVGGKRSGLASGRQVQFSGNSFSHFAGSGLALTIDQQSSDTVRLIVNGNTFSGNGGTGFTFAVTGNAGNVLSHVTGNSFTLNGGSGFHVLPTGGSGVTMFFDASGTAAARTVLGAANPNSFTGNGGSGLEIGTGVTIPDGMHLQNFGSNGMFNFVNGSSSNVDVTGNWWGTADSAAIAESILDGSDSSGLGGSSFYPYQTEAIPTSTEITASVALAQGWNIISLPVVPSNLSKTELFPASLSNAFSFNGTYQTSPALQPGKGYWLKMAAGGSQSVTGLERTSDTIDVVTGWNLVGSLSSSIASASIASIPGGITTSQFYGYAAGYYNANSIRAGRGYWIKVSSAGKLVLGTAAARMPAVNKIRIIPAAELPPPAPGAGDGDGGEEEASSATRELPKEFALRQNYPNPFNPSTAIQFDLPAASMVTLKVYNVLGQEVAAVLDAQPMDAGFRNVTFDASRLASGTYVYRIQAVRIDGNATNVFTSVKKMLLIR